MQKMCLFLVYGLLISLTAFAQTGNEFSTVEKDTVIKQCAVIRWYNYDRELTCLDIQQGITDSKMYQWDNGKIALKNDKWKALKNKAQVNTNETEYYVSNRLAKKIRKLLKREKCEGVHIFPADAVPAEYQNTFHKRPKGERVPLIEEDLKIINEREKQYRNPVKNED